MKKENEYSFISTDELINKIKNEYLMVGGHNCDVHAIIEMIHDCASIEPKYEWKFIYDELPSKTDYYLVKLDTGYVMKSWFAHKDDYYVENSEWRGITKGSKVVAWMPILEKPDGHK